MTTKTYELNIYQIDGDDGMHRIFASKRRAEATYAAYLALHGIPHDAYIRVWDGNPLEDIDAEAIEDIDLI